MSARITQNMIPRSLLLDLAERHRQAVADAAAALLGQADQRAVRRPVRRRPGAAARGDLAAEQQYQRNVNEAQSWQAATDTALGERHRRGAARPRPGRAGRERTRSAPGPRSAIATEVDQLIDSVKSRANTQYAGPLRLRRLGQTTTQPYQIGATTPTRATPRSSSARSARACRSTLNIAGSTRDRRRHARACSRRCATSRPTCNANNTAALRTPTWRRSTPPTTVSTQRATVGAREPARRPRYRGCSSSRRRPRQQLSDDRGRRHGADAGRLLDASRPCTSRRCKPAPNHPTVPDGLPAAQVRTGDAHADRQHALRDARDPRRRGHRRSRTASSACRARATRCRPDRGLAVLLAALGRRSAIALPVTIPWLFFADYEVAGLRRGRRAAAASRARAGRHLLRRPRRRAARGLHRQPARPDGRARPARGSAARSSTRPATTTSASRCSQRSS